MIRNKHDTKSYKVQKVHARQTQQEQAKKNKQRRAQLAVDSAPNSKLKRDPGVPNLSAAIARLDHRSASEAAIAAEREKRRAEKIAQQRQRAETQRLRLELSGNTATVPVDGLTKHAEDMDVAKRRWYFKEMKKVVESSDIILEVLDARDPLGCRCTEVEQMIVSKFTGDGVTPKRIILVLNKIDLVPHDVTMKWVKFFRREFPTIAFKSSTQQQRSNLAQVEYIGSDKANDSTLARSAAVGVHELLPLLKNYSRSLNMKKHITVGIIGYPNVGKSSLINSLKRRRAAAVGSTPGLTKTLQLVKLDGHISLIDSPGVMFSAGHADDDILLRNCLRVESLEDPVQAVYGVVKKCTMQTLQQVYELSDSFTDADEFLLLVARKRGKLKAGGVADIGMAARTILMDWNAGKIPYYIAPPQQQDVVESTVVSSLSQEFDLDALLKPNVEVDEKDQQLYEQQTNDADMQDDMNSSSSSSSSSSSYLGNKIGVASSVDVDDNNDDDNDVGGIEYVPKPKQSNDAIDVVIGSTAPVAPTFTPGIVTKQFTPANINNLQLNKQLKDARKKLKKQNARLNRQAAEGQPYLISTEAALPSGGDLNMG